MNHESHSPDSPPGGSESGHPGAIDHGHRPNLGGLNDFTSLKNPGEVSEDGLKPFPHSSTFSGDDGSTPHSLVEAYAIEHPHRLDAVVEALRNIRVLIPVVANLDEMETPEFEEQVVGEKSAHAAMVTVAAPDGRAAIPIFSSVAAMAAWRSDARPVPVEAPKAALAAGTEADSLLVLDPGTENTTLIPSLAVAAIATGEEWSNPLLDSEVHSAIADIVTSIPVAVRAEVQPGGSAEIRIVLALKPGLDKVGVLNASQHMSTALGSSKIITSRVDSLELRITTAKD